MDAINTIKLNRNLIEAALICAGNKDIRPYLNGVCLEIGTIESRLIATDGHRLLLARIDFQGEPARFIIPRDKLELTLKQAKKNKHEAIEVQYNWLEGDKYALLLDRDFGAVSIDGRFPDWQRVVPSSVSGDFAHYQGCYLDDFDKVARLVSGSKLAFADVVCNGTAPALVALGTDDVVGVLMPRKESSFYPAMDWVHAEITARDERKAA